MKRRIASFDKAGSALNAVLELNPDAPRDASPVRRLWRTGAVIVGKA
jgi:hypothetical protein